MNTDTTPKVFSSATIAKSLNWVNGYIIVLHIDRHSVVATIPWSSHASWLVGHQYILLSPCYSHDILMTFPWYSPAPCNDNEYFHRAALSRCQLWVEMTPCSVNMPQCIATCATAGSAKPYLVGMVLLVDHPRSQPVVKKKRVRSGLTPTYPTLKKALGIEHKLLSQWDDAPRISG